MTSKERIKHFNELYSKNPREGTEIRNHNRKKKDFWFITGKNCDILFVGTNTSDSSIYQKFESMMMGTAQNDKDVQFSF